MPTSNFIRGARSCLSATERGERAKKLLPADGGALDFHTVVVEQGAAAHVCVLLHDGRSDARTAWIELGPVALGTADDAGWHAVADLDHGQIFAAVVEDAGDVAGFEAARSRVVLVQQHLLWAGLVAHRG